MNEQERGLRGFWKRTKESLTLERVVVRLIIAWLLTAVVFYIKTAGSFNSPEYVTNVNFIMYLCFVLVFFLFFCALGYFEVFNWVETFGPMILITAYGFVTTWDSVNNIDLTYVMVLGLFLALAILYSVHKVRNFVVIEDRKVVWGIYILAGLFFFGYFGMVGVFRYLTYRAPGYDFGIWVQMFHYMKTTFQPLTTCERSELLSHFAIHFSPIYYLYLPFYMVFSSPITLAILQVLTLVSGLFPLYKLCRKKELSYSATAVFSLIYVLLPAVGCGTFYDLHENCFLLPLILWLFYYIEKDDLKFIILFSVLTCLVKEDAPMYVACIGLYMLLGKKKYTKGLFVMLGAVLYFILVTFFMQLFGAGIMESRFSNYSADNGGSLVDLLRNIVANPAYVAGECFSEDRLTFLMQMFLPLGFLPLATKHLPRFILFIPMILENLASDWQYQHNINFQYAFGTAAILLYLAVINYAELPEKARKFMGSLAICAGILFLPTCALTKNYYMAYYFAHPDNYAQLRQMEEMIPDDASVTASAFFVAHLADRDVIYEYEYIDEYITDYVVLDLRWDGVSDSTIREIEKEGYTEIARENGLYVLLQSDAYAGEE